MNTLVRLSRFYGKSPELITAEEIKKYLYYCKEECGLSNSFINQTISALKILRQDVLGLSWDVGIKIKRPRADYPMPDILSRDEVLRLIAAPTNIKHQAILAMLYSTGMRREELMNLKLSDIDSSRMVIRINLGKGNKSRDALLAVNTLTLLREYYRIFRPKPLVYVFESRSNPGQPYSPTSIAKIVSRAAEHEGITKKVHPHSLRHAFATHMLERGTNLKVIQKLLGHSSLSSTMIYVHLAAIDPSIKSPFDDPS